MHLGRCATIRGSAPDQWLPFPASPQTTVACPVLLEKPAGPQRPNRGRQLDLARLRELPSRSAYVYSRCSSPWNLSWPRGSGAAPVLSLTTGSRRSFHLQTLTAVAAVVPLPPAVKRKADGFGCSPL